MRDNRRSRLLENVFFSVQLEEKYLKSKIVYRETVKRYRETTDDKGRSTRSRTATFGVLSLFGGTQGYGYSKTESVIINCNSAWRICNKSGVRFRTHKLFVTLPIKHATIIICCRSFALKHENHENLQD
jgi:hypothetical protein